MVDFILAQVVASSSNILSSISNRVAHRQLDTPRSPMVVHLLNALLRLPGLLVDRPDNDCEHNTDLCQRCSCERGLLLLGLVRGRRNVNLSLHPTTLLVL